MIEVAIMIEGQNGLNWARWQNMARAVEDLGYAGLYRSDHFTNGRPPDIDSLELWVSLTWLASHTQRIEFGPLVSPVSFRDPVFTARIAAQVNELSDGRLRLGVGAGWQEREHEMFGYDLLDVPARFRRFEEGLEVITRLLDPGQAPVDFTGRFYRLRGAQLLPSPSGPPIVIGGNGQKRTLPLVARYADEWNAVDIPTAQARELNDYLDELLKAAGREPSAVRRTLMTSLVFGRSDDDFSNRLRGKQAGEMRDRGVIAGTGEQVREQLQQLEAAGVQRVMLRWLDLDDLAGVEALAKAVFA